MITCNPRKIDLQPNRKSQFYFKHYCHYYLCLNSKRSKFYYTFFETKRTTYMVKDMCFHQDTSIIDGSTNHYPQPRDSDNPSAKIRRGKHS